MHSSFRIHHSSFLLYAFVSLWFISGSRGTVREQVGFDEIVDVAGQYRIHIAAL
ncbi:hypothetical protein BH18ACI2_BH18ACI2_14570 [soil metagenome]